MKRIVATIGNGRIYITATEDLEVLFIDRDGKYIGTVNADSGEVERLFREFRQTGDEMGIDTNESQPKTFEDTVDEFSGYWETKSKFELTKQEAIVLIVYMRWLDEKYKFPPPGKQTEPNLVWY